MAAGSRTGPLLPCDLASILGSHQGGGWALRDGVLGAAECASALSTLRDVCRDDGEAESARPDAIGELGLVPLRRGGMGRGDGNWRDGVYRSDDSGWLTPLWRQWHQATRAGSDRGCLRETSKSTTVSGANNSCSGVDRGESSVCSPLSPLFALFEATHAQLASSCSSSYRLLPLTNPNSISIQVASFVSAFVGVCFVAWSYSDKLTLSLSTSDCDNA